MKSPFPGMDPYLERHWLDVHPALVHGMRDALNEQLTGSLRARMGERLVVEDDESTRSMYPDVRVFEKGPRRPSVEPASVAVAEPLVIRTPGDPIRQTFVQIIDIASGGRLITVIEFILPSNKHRGDGLRQYKKKQQECIDADVNLVEIDLTRAGEREMAYPLANIRADYVTTYQACVRRGWGRERYEIYRMPLRERLPGIGVPLRAEDPDAAIDIQALVDKAYHGGRYDDIDYAKPCIPPLEGEDAAWADELLKAAGKR